MAALDETLYFDDSVFSSPFLNRDRVPVKGERLAIG
jgi:hypothetical protein